MNDRCPQYGWNTNEGSLLAALEELWEKNCQLEQRVAKLEVLLRELQRSRQ